MMPEIRFASEEHENFYYRMLEKCRINDSNHRAFFYCMGISDTTRKFVGRVFDFTNDRIRPEGLSGGWQTGGTMRLTRLAFNLWNGYAEPDREAMSTPYELFDCGYAPYFFEAVKIKYPDYCREIPPGRTDRDGNRKEERKPARHNRQNEAR